MSLYKCIKEFWPKELVQWLSLLDSFWKTFGYKVTTLPIVKGDASNFASYLWAVTNEADIRENLT
jgi:hypothetical protein